MSLHINVSELLHTSNTNCCNVMWPVHIQLWPELVQELQLHSRNSSKDCLQSMRLENAEGKLQCCGLHLPLLSMRLHWCLPPAIPTSCTGATTILLPGCHHGASLSQAVIAISFSSSPKAFQVAALQLGGAPATLAIGFRTILPHCERCEACHQASCGRLENESPIVILSQEGHVSLRTHYMDWMPVICEGAIVACCWALKLPRLSLIHI